ncbi:65-kDa microtubule-associated protein 5 [Capsicum baccatum]|uniref:65-kDa microtubule-associated protein 5 n=1 Tax=Capsicum baccatum TaxID=33114 RepID=A0A2G2W3Z6_CAPBA|nr:65-kDa microtubule-associated protein 5 [Capsicum baccatum]
MDPNHNPNLGYYNISDLSGLLSSMDDQVVKDKEEAASSKDALDKMEKWKHASQEDNWLDEYEKGENRYSTGKGVHINLKNAEKAQILVSKIPSLIENLTAKINTWEKVRGIPFLYHKDLWLKKIMCDLHMEQNDSTEILVDN